MKDRLSKFITAEGLTPSLLADEINVQRSGISHILSGRNYPSFDFLQKLLERFPKINAEWLILGQGSMYKSTEAKTSDLFFPDEKTPLSPTPPEKPQIFASGEGNVVESKTEIHPPILPIEPQKTIEKIIILYNDKTFSTYFPETNSP